MGGHLTFNKTCCEEKGVPMDCMGFCRLDTTLRSLAPANACDRWENTVKECVIEAQCQEDAECPDESQFCIDRLCEEIDPCYPVTTKNYCHNGGSCMNVNGIATCVCARGFSGDQCQTTVNPGPEPTTLESGSCSHRLFE